MDIKAYMQQLGQQARSASRIIAATSTEVKNAALLAIADELNNNRQQVLAANAVDLKNGRENGLDAALLDRLELNDARIDAMIEGLQQVADLTDPIGETTELTERPSGIKLGKMRVPLGVIGIIYESRPNVTIDAASLCLKSGNATILRGGSEAINSNQAIAECITQGLKTVGLPEAVVQVIETTDRAAVGELITMSEFVDVIVPRGGKGLIERISNDARVPVIKHLDGICHVYIDDKADLIFTGTGSRTNAIKDARIFKSTFYLNKAITELHIVKPEVFQQEVHSAITNNLQLSEFSLRCKEFLVSYKDELKALKKAKKIF